MTIKINFFFCFTPTDTEQRGIGGGWLHFTDTSEQVVGYGVKEQFLVTMVKPFDLNAFFP
jgi:hypothetical protein